MGDTNRGQASEEIFIVHINCLDLVYRKWA